jgi:hypothetical protein
MNHGEEDEFDCSRKSNKIKKLQQAVPKHIGIKTVPARRVWGWIKIEWKKYKKPKRFKC